MKTITTVDQPAKTDAIGNEAQAIHHHFNQKNYRDHKIHDRTHGRVNKSPIGINFGPGIF